MLPFLLYSLTAVATGYQTYWQIMWAVWGRPIYWLEVAAIFSSLGVLFVALVALYSPRRACWIGLLCLTCLWVYYIPALAASISQLNTERLAIISIVFVPPLLLAVSTVHMLLYLARIRRNLSTSLLFPSSGNPKLGQRVVMICSTLFVVCCLTFFLFTGVEKKVPARVSWEILENNSKQFARFRFKDLAGFAGSGAETDSVKILRWLRTEKPSALAVDVVLTYDFGKVRALGFNVMYLGNVSFHPQELGHFGPYDPFVSQGR